MSQLASVDPARSADPLLRADPAPEPPAFQLTWPFAVLGLAGGWLAADGFNLVEHEVRWILALVTLMVCMVLGALLSGKLRSRPVALALSTLRAVLLAGAVNGGLLGFLAKSPEGLMFGMLLGMVCSIPFFPMLGSVVAVARRVGRARRGSLVDASDRRAVWITAMVFLVPPVLLTLHPEPPSILVAISTLFPVVAALAIAIFFALDLVALLATRALASREARFVPSGSRVASEAIERVDLGLGDELHEEVALAGSTYREHAGPKRLMYGDPASAVAALRWNVGAGAAALLLALAVLAARVAFQLPR